MVYRHDGPDDHDHEEPDSEFVEILAPDDVRNSGEYEPEPEFEYPGPSADDIARSERDAFDDGNGGEGGRWLRSAGAVLLVLAALGLLLSLVGPLAFSRGDGVPESAFLSAEVLQVLDGNTIVVTVAGETETVRYIGVSVGVQGESFYLTSQITNRSWVDGQIVTLERDGDDRDEEGRLLRYVYVDNIMINAALLASGLARYQPDQSNGRHNSMLLAAENAARNERRGIWEGDNAAEASPA
ncbi:MAG: thermonuclease family protein [Dehalococcoidia bacterium]|jgi:micrococcal nuclease|nr:thermonuclease family protein [Dehalococcoidia bacterium]